MSRLKRILKFCAPVISGALLVAGFPYYNIYVLPWVALAPLLWALRGRSTAARCLMGYVFGVTFFGLLFYWFTLCRWPASLGCLVFLLIFPAIFIPWAVLSGRAMDRGTAPALLLPALGWAALEFAMSHSAFAFPWWSLAVSQSENIVVAQMASITGMYGISFLVVCGNVLVHELAAKRLRANVPLWGGLLALFAGCLIFGAVSLLKNPGPEGQAVRVALVQPSIAQEDKLDAIDQNILDELTNMYHTFWDMSAQAAQAKPKPDLLVWPESVLPHDWLWSDSSKQMTTQYLRLFDATLLTGVYIHDYNSLIGVDPERGFLGRYDKMHLVPFGEYVPYRDALSKVPALGKWLNTAVFEEDVAPGKKLHLFETRGGKVGGVICFESMLPSIPRRLTKRGAEMLVVVTNDAWFLRSPAAAQHVGLARLRAIENRRWLAQAANSGLSVIIDSRGRIRATSSLFTKEVVHGKMHARSDISFYTKYGDVFGWLCVVLGAALTLLVRLKTPRKSTQDSTTP